MELGKTEDLNNEPAFSFEAEDCSKEFERIKNIHFLSGGRLYKKEGESEPTIFEYPLGKNFLLIDPFGNKFLMFEDFYFGSKSTYKEEKNG